MILPLTPARSGVTGPSTNAEDHGLEPPTNRAEKPRCDQMSIALANVSGPNIGLRNELVPSRLHGTPSDPIAFVRSSLKPSYFQITTRSAPTIGSLLQAI